MQRTWIIETTDKTDETVRINGWANSVRVMGDKLVFVDVRDATGLVQVVCYKPDLDDETAELVSDIKPQSALQIEGMVQKRGEKQVNPDLETGEVEIKLHSLDIVGPCRKTPPLDISKDTAHVNEKTRLKYRYLDLRTERLQKNIRLRSDFVQACRDFLFDRQFTEIETPLLTKATPEGSRDFVVPSRLQPGKFFALPQSPQQYKQLLMTGGFERYFQIARALRDEDPRADRGFEHTQIDIEMSFVERDDVMQLVEDMIINVVESFGYTIKKKPFPRISYEVAMEKYGDDKFDLRTEEEKAAGILAYAWVIDFPFFEKDENGNWTFTHNPFSAPLPEYRDDLLNGNNIGDILTSQYDLVCNGFESGGGSVRAHNPDLVRATYEIMGYSAEEIEASVGHMLEAFQYGAPPHGGIALGVERNLMNLTGEEALREVQAFPMTSSGKTAVMDAPSELPKETLDELHLKVTEADSAEE